MLYSQVFPFHSYLRWLILLIGLVAVIRFAFGWLRGGEFKGVDRGLLAAFGWLILLQALLGIILLFGLAKTGEGFPTVRFEHAGFMFAAVILAHLPARWRNAADSVRFRNAMLCILGSLGMIYFGVNLFGWYI
ncbi:MAG TPA: hypothetical protein PLF42_07710 [Anaerolineales bacterium]|nr:hypothetical protein [Anaerolineales bacterium]